MWDLATGVEEHRFSGNTSSVPAVIFAPDGASLLSAGSDQIIRQWKFGVAPGSVNPIAMKRLSLRKFGLLVRRVLDALPAEIAQYLDNVVVDVEEEPDEDTLRSMGFTDAEIAEGESLYGLFVPLPLGQPDDIDFVEQPHRIIIYKQPLEEDFPEPRQLRIEIRKTVIHELAHHFGWDDRDLEKFDDTDDPFGDEN